MWRNDNIWTRNLKVLIAADQRWLRTTQLRSCGTVISKKDKQLLANQQDVVADKEQKTAVLIDVTGTAGRRGTKKIKNYQRLKKQLEEIWTSPKWSWW